ncbi:9735_t:CDS:2 [Funneliformis caledonium]|uniref:9735_t:CDS:1 n=1 Tax=Funneliformis caledonium TaxID=1117310 RepID=A0A9N8W3L3_9GLOM|nr:9735_t:CDS:2 [Funneliformis caledonium]
MHEDKHEDNFTVNKIDVNECDVNEYNININKVLVEAEEEPNFEHINNYILQIPEIVYQITSIDTRSISNQSVLQFLDAAYAEFIDLVLTHHFSNSTENDILK